MKKLIILLGLVTSVGFAAPFNTHEEVSDPVPMEQSLNCKFTLWSYWFGDAEAIITCIYSDLMLVFPNFTIDDIEDELEAISRGER